MKPAIKFSRFRKIPLYAILFSVICFLILASLVFIGFNKQQKNKEKYKQLSSFSCANTHSRFPPPSDGSYVKIDGYSTSPDGTKQITVKSANLEVTTINGKLEVNGYNPWQKAILTGTAVSHPIELVNTPGSFMDNVGNNFIISWSPDSRYFYTIKPAFKGNDIIVFRTDGAKFSTGKCYLDGANLPSNTDYDLNSLYTFGDIGDIKWLNNSLIQFITVPDVSPGFFTSFLTQKRKYILDLEKETLESSPRW